MSDLKELAKKTIDDEFGFLSLNDKDDEGEEDSKLVRYINLDHLKIKNQPPPQLQPCSPSYVLHTLKDLREHSLALRIME